MGFVSNMFGAKNNYNAQTGYEGEPGVIAQGVTDVNKSANGQFALAKQLQQQAAGGGPNPALAQLNQTTQQNNQNASGLIASQRGINPALATKMAAAQASQNNGMAAGQAATMRAQQQLGAQANLGNLYGQVANEGLGQQGVYNQANLGAQQINAGVKSQNANTNAGVGGGILGALGSAMAGPSLSKAHGGMIQKMANGGPLLPMPQMGSQLDQPAPNFGIPGIDPTSSPGAPSLGGDTSLNNVALNSNAIKAPTPVSKVGKALAGIGQSMVNASAGNVGYNPTTGAPSVMVNTQGGQQAFASGLGSIAKNINPSQQKPLKSLEGSLGSAAGGAAAGGGGAAAGGSGGIGGLASLAALLAHGGMTNTGSKLKAGGKVPGKAKVPGDSLKNDTVKAQLSPGEIVIPRSISQGPNAPDKAREFVAAILARQGLRGQNKRK